MEEGNHLHKEMESCHSLAFYFHEVEILERPFCKDQNSIWNSCADHRSEFFPMDSFLLEVFSLVSIQGQNQSPAEEDNL